jgi:two-component system chemotaxis sensor kinase CheA
MLDDKRQKIINIFISEATEIIEDLDIQLMNLEEDIDNKEIINVIFRGVHTLKGNANSFGFNRLGDFVHHWEDLLDHYRSDDARISEDTMELFLDSFEVLKQVMDYEMNGVDGVPENYQRCLTMIKDELNNQNGNSEPEPTPKPVPAPTPVVESKPQLEETKPEVVEEFSFDLNYADSGIDKNEIKELGSLRHQDILKAFDKGKTLYRVVLSFDSDLYFRGHNHNILIKVLADVSTIVKSFWDISEVPAIEEYEPSQSYIKTISVYLYTDESPEAIEEGFEFVAEDHEVKIHRFSKNEFMSLIDTAESKQEDIVVTEQIKEPEPEPTPIKVEEKPKPTPQKAPVAQNVKKIEEPTAPPEPMGSVPEAQSAKKVINSFIKIESAKVDELFDSVGELVIAGSYLYQNEKIRALNEADINQNLEALAKSTKLIQHKVMSLRMVPIRNTFNKMKRVVRDVSKKTGKEVNLIISGEDTEIDKTMVDDLADPLVHLVRNAIDHGLESTAEREQAGKNPVGNVWLQAYHKGNNIVIEIKEDGRGINKDGVLQKAINKGLCKPNQNLTDKEIVEFIFNPGFSTAQQISDVSGRGVGLDVVKTSIEKLKGKIDVDTKPGQGTSFKIILPLTLAIIDGMLVSVANDVFIIPTLNVIESFRPSREDVQSVSKRGEFIDFRGEILPIIRLNHILKLSDDYRDPTESTLICMEHEKGKFILLVDELIGRQQVVVKTLGKFLSNIKEIAGGAILGNGEISLILNIEGLRNYLDQDMKK